MKKLNLKLEGIGQMLTKDEMKRVVGGYDNPNCAGTTVGTWYCCGGGPSGTNSSFPDTSCNYVSSHNSCSMVTNDVSRC